MVISAGFSMGISLFSVGYLLAMIYETGLTMDLMGLY